MGLPHLTGFEDRLGHRAPPLQAANRTGELWPFADGGGPGRRDSRGVHRLAGLAAIALLLATGAQASVRPSAAPISIRAGDELRLAGSLTGCVVQELAVVCMHQARPSPAGLIAAQTGSYGTLILGFRQGVQLFRKGAGSATTTLFERLPKGTPSIGAVALAPEQADRTLTLRVGQVVRVQGTRLDCAVVRSGTPSVPTIYCSNDDARGPIPGSYATLVSDHDAAVGLVQRSRSTTVVALRRQP